MRAIVKTKDLAKIVSRAASLAIAEAGILINAKKLASDNADSNSIGQVSVTAFDGSTVCRWNCVAEIEQEGRIAVRGKSFENLLKASTKSDSNVGIQTIETDNRDSLRLTTSRGAHELDSLDMQVFDDIEPGSVQGDFADMSALGDALSKAKNFAAAAADTSGARLCLSGVYLRKLEHLEIVGTEGHKMIQIRLDHGVTSALLLPDEEGITIPGAMVARIAPLLSEEEARIGIADGSMVVETPSGTLAFQLLEVPYVDYERVLAVRPEHMILLSKDFFSTALERCSATVAQEDRFNTATIESGPDGTRLTSITSQDSSSEQISETAAPEASVSFNVAYMKKALASITDNRVRFRFTDHNQPILLGAESNSNVLVMIMPCRPPAPRGN